MGFPLPNFGEALENWVKGKLNALLAKHPKLKALPASAQSDINLMAPALAKFDQSAFKADLLKYFPNATQTEIEDFIHGTAGLLSLEQTLASEVAAAAKEI